MAIDWEDRVPKRDFQHSKDGPEKLPNKKLGKKNAGCKKNKGKPHNYKLVKKNCWPMSHSKPMEWNDYACTDCGKKQMVDVKDGVETGKLKP